MPQTTCEHEMNTGYHCTICHITDPELFWATMRGMCREDYIAMRREHRRAKADWLRNLKATTPCSDCGQIYPFYVMDFDHVEGKDFNIGSEGTDKSWKVLREEVMKCDIVCANCHRQRTFDQGIWSREDE